MESQITFSNFKYVLNTLFVHLDDPNENLQKAVKSALEKWMEFNKEKFVEVANEVLPRHRHPQAVSELIELANN